MTILSFTVENLYLERPSIYWDLDLSENWDLSITRIQNVILKYIFLFGCKNIAAESEMREVFLGILLMASQHWIR